MESSLGTIPGAGAVPFGIAPGEGGDVLGGRIGTGFPRVPTTITSPNAGQISRPIGPGMAPPPALPAPTQPVFGRMELATGPDAEGPPDGMTLDMAIERLMHFNLDIRSRSLEIPQAQADVLTASLRANPILYADSQLIPYGQFSERRAGGPTQYDLNITHPLDLNHKRRYRIDSAVKAKRVLEAKYQDFVRLEIANLYVAYVDVLATRQSLRYAKVRLDGLGELVGVYRKLFQKGPNTVAEVERAEIQRVLAETTLMDEQERYRRAKQILGALLQMTPADADQLELRGLITDLAPEPPGWEELARVAFACRPDLVAYRMGIQRAQADVRLAKANRLQDVYLLVQPFTFQNNAPFGKESAHSWGIGMSVPLPLYNRNQGVIQRANLNVTQTQIEMAWLEQQVVNEVKLAHREYAHTRGIAKRFENDLLGRVKSMRDHEHRLFVAGEAQNVIPYINAERDYNDMLRQYTDIAIRHRRSMLTLNTAVGQRVLP
jgi:outer membrane protein, heavy metal efflux system